jgi:hypothetical protein
MAAAAVRAAEELAEREMAGRDASHDAAHALRVRDLALSLAAELGLSSSPDRLLIVEIAALLHDIGKLMMFLISLVLCGGEKMPCFFFFLLIRFLQVITSTPSEDTSPVAR